ncbi:nitrate reductase molybdenum cofactor assembly chaperone [Yimella sp. NH-Cas1]|uniref:nitrate reductase molybdenum cofactor assembly chaperone n=1 Tax=Yimella sp. NH-Cas1 TaxID=2917726 RepID=UPI001EFB9FEC|nr:nitrate reductase molybdenum cofactor assembly chaperone [Yimella sp. NH-Cas1]MCG8654701.1 nitrate reductase molybdenum cofactor assembly chaperone [Yimella sp. NH-Cas1]
MNIFRRVAKSNRSRLPEDQLRVVWQAVSLLLEYPHDDSDEQRAMIRASITDLPATVRDPLNAFLDHAQQVPLQDLQADFVETFDHTRRGCLYLTYFAYGDTRRRGVVLVQFKQAYRKGGAEFESDELPDHIAVVLEFGATVDVQTSWKLLGDYRAGVEMLRIALQDKGSAWANVLIALCATLPPLGDDEVQAVALLIEQGPPQEDVGMDGYGMDPALDAPSPGAFTPPTIANAPEFLGNEIPVGAPR